jgi:hypothetical protein
MLLLALVAVGLFDEIWNQRYAYWSAVQARPGEPSRIEAAIMQSRRDGFILGFILLLIGAPLTYYCRPRRRQRSVDFEGSAGDLATLAPFDARDALATAGVDRLCLRFDASCRAGEKPDPEQFLKSVALAFYDVLNVRLSALGQWHRLARLSRRMDAPKYQRISQPPAPEDHGDSLSILADLLTSFCAEYELSCVSGPPTNHQVFFKRKVSAWYPELLDLLSNYVSTAAGPGHSSPR